MRAGGDSLHLGVLFRRRACIYTNRRTTLLDVHTFCTIRIAWQASRRSSSTDYQRLRSCGRRAAMNKGTTGAKDG